MSQADGLSVGMKGDIADAANRWNTVLGDVFVPSGGNSQNSQDSGGGDPTLVIVTVDDTGADWGGIYRPGSLQDGIPARVILNEAKLRGLSPDQRRGVIAHELGHALGLRDVSNRDSLMFGEPGHATSPTSGDVSAFNSAAQGSGTGSQQCASTSDWEMFSFPKCIGPTDPDTGGCKWARWFTEENMLKMVEYISDAALVVSVIATLGADAPEAIAAGVAIRAATQAAIKKAAEEGLSKEAAEAAGKAAAERATAEAAAKLEADLESAEAGMEAEAAEENRVLGQCANSFPGDTPVRLPTGETRSISDIRVGDRVVATDPTTGATKNEPVTDVIIGSGKHTMVRALLDKGEITATENHQFWAPDRGSYAPIRAFKPGDHVRLIDGTTATVLGVIRSEEIIKVFNLEVAELHSYYAGTAGVLVHNACYPTMNNGQAREAAKQLGFREVGAQGKGKALVFTDGKVYISADRDGHNVSNGWKMAKTIDGLKSKGTRMGTYDGNLNKVGD